MKRRIHGLCCHGSWPYETNTETAEVASTWTSRVFREAIYPQQSNPKTSDFIYPRFQQIRSQVVR